MLYEKISFFIDKSGECWSLFEVFFQLFSIVKKVCVSALIKESKLNGKLNSTCFFIISFVFFLICCKSRSYEKTSAKNEFAFCLHFVTAYKSSIILSVFSAEPSSPVSFLCIRARATVMAEVERLSRCAICDTGIPVFTKWQI